jgi:predicted DCC family thiol-disulfide oxidoreductase YuxK
MDARPLALTRLTLGVVALVGCICGFFGAPGWHLAAAIAGVLTSLAVVLGWRTRLMALLTAGALVLAAPAHGLLRLLLILLAFTDSGARASIEPRRARATVPVAPVVVLLLGAVSGVVLAVVRHRLGALDLAAAAAVALVLLPSALFTALGRAVAARTTPMDVIYDGQCSFCRRSVDTLLVLDVSERLQPRDSHAPETRAQHPDLDPERAQREMLVWDGERLEGGFDAFRLMAWKLPVLWPVVLFLYVPPVPQLGRVVYRYIAANRTKIACELNLAPPRRPTPDPSPRSLPLAAGALILLVAAGLESLLALGWL